MRYLGMLLLFCAVQAFTQPNLRPSEETVKAMSHLNAYEGNWSGDGWVQMGPQRSLFTVNEFAHSKVGGGVFVFEGLGKDKETEKVIHQAYGIVTYDDETDSYSMRAFRADAKSMDAPFKVDENGVIEWGLEVPQGKISYHIEIVDGQWIEKGNIDMGNGRLFQFLEMTLVKK